MLHYYQAVLGDDLPDHKGPLTTPSSRLATAEASNQVGTCGGDCECAEKGHGRFNVKTST